MKPCLWIAGELWGDARFDMRCATGVVNHVVDGAEVSKSHGDHVAELHAGGLGYLDGAREPDVGVAEDAIDAEAEGLVTGDVVGHLVGGPAVDVGGRGPGGLRGRV